PPSAGVLSSRPHAMYGSCRREHAGDGSAPGTDWPWEPGYCPRFSVEAVGWIWRFRADGWNPPRQKPAALPNWHAIHGSARSITPPNWHRHNRRPSAAFAASPPIRIFVTRCAVKEAKTRIPGRARHHRPATPPVPVRGLTIHNEWYLIYHQPRRKTWI